MKKTSIRRKQKLVLAPETVRLLNDAAWEAVRGKQEQECQWYATASCHATITGC